MAPTSDAKLFLSLCPKCHPIPYEMQTMSVLLCSWSTENYQLYVPESAQVGKPVGKIKANDEDLGVNAAIKYSIINSEGAAMFSIATDRDTREGIISLKKVYRVNE